MICAKGALISTARISGRGTMISLTGRAPMSRTPPIIRRRSEDIPLTPSVSRSLISSSFRAARLAAALVLGSLEKKPGDESDGFNERIKKDDEQAEGLDEQQRDLHGMVGGKGFGVDLAEEQDEEGRGQRGQQNGLVPVVGYDGQKRRAWPPRRPRC